MSGDYDKCPTATCPRCGAEVEDHDGFGVLAHVQPHHADGCGYCSHPSRDGDGHGGWVCGICGDVRREVGTDPAMDAGPTCLYMVQTVDVDCDDCLQPPEACALCENGSMFIRVEDEIPFGGIDDDEVCYGPLDDCHCSRCRARFEAEAESWVPRKMRRMFWLKEDGYDNISHYRREKHAIRRRIKRLSAMRRQGKGGGR